MKKLRVLVQFRDQSNFFTIHQKGDMIVVDDSRAARLIDLKLCEEIVDNPKTEISDSSVSEEPAAPVVEKPKRAYNRKKKEA